eukprot:8995415-Lingulodinium_polyedra.AAC.1
MKLNYGPGGSTAWWEKQKTVALELFEFASVADPLVQSLLGFIKEDLLLQSDCPGSEVADDEVLAHARSLECWRTKGPLLALRRWFS